MRRGRKNPFAIQLDKLQAQCAGSGCKQVAGYTHVTVTSGVGGDGGDGSGGGKW